MLKAHFLSHFTKRGSAGIFSIFYTFICLAMDFVQSWLVENGFSGYCSVFKENEIDKEALLELTERALELLVPVIGHRMKFLSKLKKLQEESERVSEVLSDHQPDVVVCSPGTKKDSRTNKFSTPAGQSKIRKSITFSPSPDKVVLNARQPWPSRVELPKNLRPDLADVLASKDSSKLTRKLRNAFIAHLYEHFSQYTLYPTRMQLLEIVQLVVKHYPFLKDKSVGSGHDSWLAQLYEKFRNERRNSSDDVVIIHKRKGKTATSSPNTNLRRGAINYEPPFPEAEDETSLKKHIEYMQNEWCKASPDQEKLRRRMVLTFPGRRRMMNAQLPLVEIRSEFPALFCQEEIIAEFERLLGVTTSVEGMFQQNFAQVSQAILCIAAKLRGRKPSVDGLLKLLEKDPLDDMETESTEDEKAMVAMSVLPAILDTRAKKSDYKLVHVIKDDDDVLQHLEGLTPDPTIIVKGSLDAPSQVMIAAEKQMVCQIMDRNVLNAHLCFMAICYVFMFTYPPPIKNFCLYLQKCVLQIKDGKKLPTCIMSFINDIDCLVTKSSL